MTIRLNNPESRMLRFMSLHSFNTEQVVKLLMERIISQMRCWDGSNVQNYIGYWLYPQDSVYRLDGNLTWIRSKDREQNQKVLARNLRFILIATAHAQSMLVTQHPHIVSQFSLTNILWSDLIQVRFRILPGRVGWVECITEVASGGSTFHRKHSCQWSWHKDKGVKSDSTWVLRSWKNTNRIRQLLESATISGENKATTTGSTKTLFRKSSPTCLFFQNVLLGDLVWGRCDVVITFASISRKRHRVALCSIPRSTPKRRALHKAQQTGPTSYWKEKLGISNIS